MGIRGPRPSESTIRMLCAISGGQCEFPGCRQRFFFDTASGTQINNSYIAHIVASNPDGPRGSSSSNEISNELDNLMLLCATHHRLIDNNPDQYPVTCLQKMKKDHEEKIDFICNLLSKTDTEILTFTSKIKNTKEASIPLQQAIKAVVPFYSLSSKHGIPVIITSSYKYNSKAYWKDVKNQLNTWNQTTFQAIKTRAPGMHFSVFPLAPIPLIIKLGELFGDKIPCDVYQKRRYPDSWCWEEESLTNNYLIKEASCKNGENIALFINLTASISIKHITKKFNIKYSYIIEAENKDVDCIKSKKDLSLFWHKYQEVCEMIIQKHGRDIIYLFPAIPVSAAFEIGRRYMPGVYPPFVIFDNNKGFFKTLTIGE